MPELVRIGISANFFHRDPDRPVFRHKTLQFLEERMALALWRAGALPLLIPDVKAQTASTAWFNHIDGLVLAGGADVCPRTYGEEPLRDHWQGDAVRDAYECALISAACSSQVPVLGICRGLQILNVALGGTLWQDIETQVPATLTHRDWHRYDENGHAVRLEPGSWVSRVYGDAHELDVNSVHHQGVHRLASGLRGTAWAPDGIIEAAESISDQKFLVGLQWHPEWLDDEAIGPGGPAQGRVCGTPLFSAFVDECRLRAARRSPSSEVAP